MNDALQALEVKVENGGATPQGKVFAKEWNVLVEAVKALDLKEFDEAALHKFLQDNGYITEDNIPTTDLSGVVTLATEQAISGRKNFVGGVEVNGQELIYDAEKKVWQLTGDLVVTGAISMFSNLTNFTPSTVTEAVEVDGTTIVKTRNSQGQWQLTAIGGGGSGGTSGGLTATEVNVLIEAALVPYALKTAIPTDNNQLSNSAGYITASALTGYASEEWVSNQGYAKQSALTAVDNRLTAVEVFFATEDSDTLINKWDEIVAFLNATEGDTLDNILKTKANQSALDDAVASLTTEIGKKWTQNDAKIANWDAAYGWGNHANAGYAAKTYVDGELAKYVKLAVAQSIEAQHNFVNGLKIGGLGITKSQDDVIYVDANLVVRGAVTMFGSGATIAPSIWASIPFDLNTMEWTGSEWRVIGGGSGSVNEATVNNLIYEYLTQNNYAKISDISSALTGYATQSWVEGKKYLTGITSSQVTTALGYTPYNSSNPDKYIKGIDYDMVIAALGYTPYSTTNPMGYLTISSLLGYATEQWVGDNYLPSANFTKANIKSTLGISDWALSATKPSYTAAEVGALSLNGGTISGNLSLKETNSIILRPSLYTHYSGIGYDTKGDECIAIWAKNAATRLRWHAGINLVEGVTINSMMGITPDFEISKASGIAEGYIGGHAIIHSNNIGSYNAGSATKLQTPRAIWGQSFDGTGDITGQFRLLYQDSFNGNVAHSILNHEVSPYGLLTRIYGSGAVSLQAQRETTATEFFPLYLNPLGGNVAIGGTTADAKLHIHGNARIDGEFYINNKTILHLDDSNTWVNYGGANDGLDLRLCGRELIFQYGRGDAFTRAMTITSGGNVAIGGTTADAKLHIHGDILATGAITMFSQLSMKNVIDYDGLSLAQLAQIKPARFTWKDRRDNRTHVGCIADYIQPILPEVVYETVNKELTVDYGSAAFYIGTSLIKPVVELWDVKDNHEKRIAELERENKRKDEVIAILQNKLNQLSA